MEGLISDKGGDDQISTATRILAEVIASDATWLMVFNRAIERILANNQKVRENPRGLSQLDGYKRGLVKELREEFGSGRCSGEDRGAAHWTQDQVGL